MLDEAAVAWFDALVLEPVPTTVVERVLIERDVEIPLRDGTVLRADVWRPAGDGRHPTILQRLPYDKANSFITAHLYGLEPLRAVAAGFNLVLQDCRGTGTSDGVFRPFVDESQDGADTIAWIAGQPYSDGNVVMYGASYVGATQLLAATADPAALRAIAPHLTASEYHEGWIYQGGAFQLGFALSWSLGALGAAALVKKAAAGEDVGALADEFAAANAAMDPYFARLPLTDQPLVNTLVPAYREWLGRPERDAAWQATAISERYGSIDVPALHIGGWSDIFLEGTLRNYVGLRAGAATEAARDGQRLVIGPWAHGNPHEVVGELDHGPSASQLAVDMTSLHLAFFEAVLRGESPPGPPVRLFTMGANTWRDEDEWPLRRARVQRLYLRGGGRANGAAGDGGLSATAPGDEPPDHYVYNPRDPVPTVGGCTLLPSPLIGVRSGPREQRAIEARGDVLVYTSEPLEQDTEVTGEVRLTLFAASSAPDTDWTAKLVDVHPDGRAIGIADGILRARYREGLERPVLLEPERPERFEVVLGSTSMLFRAGHRIRLQVSSSNFPRFSRHPNTAGDLAAATEADLRPALQTVFHDGERASYLELPIVPSP